MVGFGVNSELNCWKFDAVIDTFEKLEARYPQVKGVFGWRLDWDARDGYPFAKQPGPLATDEPGGFLQVTVMNWTVMN